jgi:SAM-dependent methyltransferase
MTNQRQRWNALIQTTWNARAASWDAMSAANAATPERQEYLDRVTRRLNVSPGSRILDAGCGTGHFAIALARRGYEVTGVDLSPAMLERARANAMRAGVSVEWHQGDIASISDSDSSYDAVFARVVLQFVSNVPAVIHEFSRVLRPAGRLLASVPGALSPIYSDGWRRHVEPDEFAVNFMVPWELASILTHFGWGIVDQWGEFGPNLAGDSNALAQMQAIDIERRIQQAASTTWTFVATR